MKHRTKALIGTLLLTQAAYNWYSADVTILKAMAYVHERYEAKMAERVDEPRQMQVAALEEVLNMAPTDVCKHNGACNKTLLQMQR
ncbi:hypothetical protein LZG74_25375 [Dyadobacter sp. CY327]|uniref:hypothetical protein n=1 Tax=Dyadobacter sp. CY327 TaxID=2907301 RepID=UPI001F3247CD|nr:hypothetical protein [Dyadobacter sp. CY327]MCE7073666.1 hypothetical protein [Dyadobacter sp. CY327]